MRGNETTELTELSKAYHWASSSDINLSFFKLRDSSSVLVLLAQQNTGKHSREASVLWSHHFCSDRRGVNRAQGRNIGVRCL